MTAERIQRWGGAALGLGGVLFLINILYGDTVYAGFRPSHADESAWKAFGTIGLIGAPLVVLGFTALYARTSDAVGAAGMWGYALSASAGMIFGVGLGSIYTVAVPLMDKADRVAWDMASGAQPAGSIALLFLGATLLYVVGFALWGWAARRAHALPTWASWGMLISAALALVLTIARLAQPTLPALLADVPYLLLFGGAVVLGYQLWAGPAPAASTRPASAMR